MNSQWCECTNNRQKASIKTQRIFLFFVVFSALASCQNRTQPIGLDSKAKTPCVAKCIEEAFSYFIAHEQDPDTSNFYALVFENGVPEFGLLNDTAICFYKLHTRYYEEWIKDSLIDSYKGIMMINQYKLVVFDENDVGEHFYNNSCLEPTDLNSLNLPSLEGLTLVMTLVLDDGKYLQWYDVQPEDWSPIKIQKLF